MPTSAASRTRVGGMTGGLVEDSVFEMAAAAGDARAIYFADPAAANKSYGLTVRNNDFIGPKDGGVHHVAVVAQCQRTNRALDDDRLGVRWVAGAGGGVAGVADGHVAG
ncbi:MAG: hypothetical protein IIC29_01480, partial [Chloroflexi bacterium]|nr:hypothetical protein [Chloroflexota bacterium]